MLSAKPRFIYQDGNWVAHHKMSVWGTDVWIWLPTLVKHPNLKYAWRLYQCTVSNQTSQV